jgi:hypothetical protein
MKKKSSKRKGSSANVANITVTANTPREVSLCLSNVTAEVIFNEVTP